MRAEAVARRYALAFLDTVPPKAGAAVDARLAQAAAVLLTPPVGSLFLHPGVAAADKVRATSQVFPDDADIAHLLGVLIRHRREGLLALVARQFHSARLARDGRVSATVRTAGPLAAGWRERVVDGLSRYAGRTVEAEFQVAADLMGGIEVRMGDRLWDGTIKGRLTRLARELKDEVKLGES